MNRPPRELPANPVKYTVLHFDLPGSRYLDQTLMYPDGITTLWVKGVHFPGMCVGTVPRSAN